MAVLTFEDFKDRIGEVFIVDDDFAPDLPLSLETAEPLPARGGPENMRPPFTLLFLGASPAILPQKLYALSHEAMGRLEIFLVPVGKSERGVSYEAVFN